MDGYIFDIRNKYSHMITKKLQHLLHNHRPIYYGAKQQMVQPADTSPCLYDKGIKRVQGILGALIYAGREINNKLVVSFSAIVAHQAAETVETEDAIEQLLDYVATYPEDVILFH